MAFFDDLGKKISKAGQTAAQKTKEMTDIAKLNSAISEEEKRINNNYNQIGKLYVTLHSTDYENEFAEMVEAIKASEEKISSYRQQVKDIKGTIKCSCCGAEIPINSAFCNVCGSPIEKQMTDIDNEVKVIRCTGCGAVLEQNMKFCTTCGKLVNDIVQEEIFVDEESEEVSDETAFVEEVIEEDISNETSVIEDEIPREKTCPNCGKSVKMEVAFCIECGYKF